MLFCFGWLLRSRFINLGSCTSELKYKWGKMGTLTENGSGEKIRLICRFGHNKCSFYETTRQFIMKCKLWMDGNSHNYLYILLSSAFSILNLTYTAFSDYISEKMKSSWFLLVFIAFKGRENSSGIPLVQQVVRRAQDHHIICVLVFITFWTSIAKGHKNLFQINGAMEGSFMKRSHGNLVILTIEKIRTPEYILCTGFVPSCDEY